jgi:hypothetical protein
MWITLKGSQQMTKEEPFVHIELLDYRWKRAWKWQRRDTVIVIVALAACFAVATGICWLFGIAGL